MDDVKELKAKVYDLLCQKQKIEEELQRTNMKIIELTKSGAEK